jgi:hypothetical protein
VFFDLLGQRPTHDGWVFCLLPVALIGFSVLNIIRYERALVSSPPDC